MLISCKCLNFIATSNGLQQHQQQKKSTNAAVATADAPATLHQQQLLLDEDCNMTGGSGAAILQQTLLHAFLQKYPRNFVFYSQCINFFKEAVGPIPDLIINAINQRDLIYSITLHIADPQSPTPQSWQLSICINCNVAVCAKRVNNNNNSNSNGNGGAMTPSGNAPQFLLNATLMTCADQLSHRRADKSFSDTFNLLIIDHPGLERQLSNGSGNGLSGSELANSGGVTTPGDSKQARLRQLQQHMQQRLKREIAETDERIERYKEQQFALLKRFREMSELEYALLAQLVQRIPEQQPAIGVAGSADWMDRSLPLLEVNGGGVSLLSSRRRNTITSRRELNTAAAAATTATAATMTTPTTPTAPQPLSRVRFPTAVVGSVAPTPATVGVPSAANNNQPGTAGVTVMLTANSRKLSYTDTPPATPEATPMSVGNSPTFGRLSQSNSFQLQQLQQQQSLNSASLDAADECLFELEGVEEPPMTQTAPQGGHISFSLQHNQQSSSPMSMQARHQHSYQNHQQHSNQMHQQWHNNNISDGPDEAEDALDAAQMLIYGKSLPIQIAHSPAMAARSYIAECDPDALDNRVDIAASIKALARSVHGERVFGDLPSPRLSSQI